MVWKQCNIITLDAICKSEILVMWLWMFLFCGNCVHFEPLSYTNMGQLTPILHCRNTSIRILHRHFVQLSSVIHSYTALTLRKCNEVGDTSKLLHFYRFLVPLSLSSRFHSGFRTGVKPICPWISKYGVRMCGERGRRRKETSVSSFRYHSDIRKMIKLWNSSLRLKKRIFWKRKTEIFTSSPTYRHVFRDFTGTIHIQYR
jgi:hypothetical protein